MLHFVFDLQFIEYFNLRNSVQTTLANKANYFSNIIKNYLIFVL